MSFYVDGSGYAQTGAAAFTYGTFQQAPSQQVIDTSASAYGYGGTNLQGDAAQWQQQMQQQANQHNGVNMSHYQQMSTVAAAQGHHAAAAGHHAAVATNYGPIGGPILRQGPQMAVRGAAHLGHRGGHMGQHHQAHRVVAIRGGGHRGGGHRGGGHMRGMYGGHGGHQNTVQGPKPIKATEIKSYLYAWCTQKKLKPEYTYEPQGRSPKVRYLCTLTISGIDFKASEEARSKREAQTASAWSFCDEMVRKGYMKASELPPKQNPLVAAAAPPPLSDNGQTIHQDDTNTTDEQQEELPANPEYGGWTIDNSRQRLNRFCMSERISCDFENIVEGTITKTTISKLKLDIKRLPHPLVVETRASNKKQANASCAVLAVRALFKHGLIEKFGERIMNSSWKQHGAGSEEMNMDTAEGDSLNGAEVDATQPPKHGVKRKAEEALQFDENGNWTLETARAKLQDFFAINGKDLSFDEKEIGTLQDRQYQFSVSITVSSKSFAAAAVATNKKSAQKKCALDMVIQLYKEKMIEGNTGKRIKPRQGPSAVKRVKTSGVIVHGGPHIMPNPRVLIPNWGPGRTTPYDDRHIKAKLDELEQDKAEKAAIGSIIEEVETILKAVGDKMAGGKMDEERPLHDVVRIGSFPMGTMLKGETEIELILLTREKPTMKILAEIFCMIKEHETAAQYEIEQDRENAQITMKRAEGEVVYTTNLYLSSEKYNKEETTSEPADPDPVDILPRNKCLEYLIQLHQAQFFQSCAHPMVNAVPVARVIKSIIANDPTWNEISAWISALLVQRAMESTGHPTTAGDALRRVFTILASGLILQENQGLADPTAGGKDAIAHLSKQEREDITYKSQHALRLIAFNQINVVLGMDKIERSLKEPKPEAVVVVQPAV